MTAAIVGALTMTVGLSMAIIAVRRLQRFCDPPPPEHCGPPWLSGGADECDCNIDTADHSVPPIALLSFDRTAATFDFSLGDLGVDQGEIVGHELQLIVESTDNKFMFVALATSSGGVEFSVDGARNSPFGEHRYSVRDADDCGRVLARGKYQILPDLSEKGPSDHDDIDWGDDTVDDCEICGGPPVVSIVRNDTEAGTFHAVVLCDDCYHDDLAFTCGWR